MARARAEVIRQLLLTSRTEASTDGNAADGSEAEGESAFGAVMVQTAEGADGATKAG